MSGAGRTLDVANRHPRLKIDRQALAAAIGLLDSRAAEFKGGCPPGDLSVAFVADPELARIHARYLDDPSVTDVITFAGDPAHAFAGEICVSADAALRQAGKAPGARSDELTLYVVHGWLHLAGYGDTDPPARRAMRRAEARALRILSRSGALPRFKLA
jgi:probable rRNA maturation factor